MAYGRKKIIILYSQDEVGKRINKFIISLGTYIYLVEK